MLHSFNPNTPPNSAVISMLTATAFSQLVCSLLQVHTSRSSSGKQSCTIRLPLGRPPVRLRVSVEVAAAQVAIRDGATPIIVGARAGGRVAKKAESEMTTVRPQMSPDSCYYVSGLKQRRNKRLLAGARGGEDGTRASHTRLERIWSGCGSVLDQVE